MKVSDASSSFVEFITQNVVNIIAIIGTGIGLSKYVEDRNNKKIESAKREMAASFEVRVGEVNNNITALKNNTDMVKQYIERDITRLEREIDDLKNGIRK